MKVNPLFFLTLAVVGCATPAMPPTPAAGHPAHPEAGAAPRPGMTGLLETRPRPLPPLPVPPSDPTPESPGLHSGPEARLPDVGSVGGLDDVAAPEHGRDRMGEDAQHDHR